MLAGRQRLDLRHTDNPRLGCGAMGYFPRDPFEEVEESEFGVERGGGIGWDNKKPWHQQRQRGVPHDEGGPHRPLSPASHSVNAGKQTGVPGRRIAP